MLVLQHSDVSVAITIRVSPSKVCCRPKWQCVRMHVPATQTRTEDSRTVCTSRAVQDPGRERQMMMIWSGLGRNMGR